MTRAAPFTWDELADNSLRLPAACAAGVHAEFYVRHTTRRTPTGPLDIGYGAECEPVTHTLEARLTRFHLEEVGPSSLPRGTWDRVAALPDVDVERDDVDYQAPAVIIGRLTIGEYPDYLRCDCSGRPGISWFDWLDGEGTELGAIADRTQHQARYEFAPSQGSLFWCKRRSVHPAFRGQHLGARLLAHALWTLPRRVEDLALMEVMPMDGEFGGPPPVRTRAAILGLARYYERLGLTRWRTRRSPRALPPDAIIAEGSAEIAPPVLYHRGAERLAFECPAPLAAPPADTA